MAATNHVQHRLAFFFFDDFERALERRQLWLPYLDDFVSFGTPASFLAPSSTSAVVRLFVDPNNQWLRSGRHKNRSIIAV
jgi:hypothetical protein